MDHGRVIAIGSVSEILGGAASVRLRVTNLDGAGRMALQHFGALDQEGDWITIRGIDEGLIPELVGEIVRLGGRVHAVEPRHLTLEDRFLQLLGGPA